MTPSICARVWQPRRTTAVPLSGGAAFFLPQTKTSTANDSNFHDARPLIVVRVVKNNRLPSFESSRVYRCLDTGAFELARAALDGVVDPGDVVFGTPGTEEMRSIALRATTFVWSADAPAEERDSAGAWIALLIRHGFEVRQLEVSAEETAEGLRSRLAEGGDPIDLAPPSDTAVSLDEAQAQIDRALAEWPIVRERMVLGISVGAGKTEAVMRRLASGVEFRGRVTLFFAPTHALCRDVVRRFTAMRSPDSPVILHWHGRSADLEVEREDGVAEKHPMCGRRQLAETVGALGMSVKEKLCGTDDNPCPLKAHCLFIDQEEQLRRALDDERGVIIVMPHRYLTMSGAASGPTPIIKAQRDADPDFVVIDEAFWQELTHERPVDVSREELTAKRTVVDSKGRHLPELDAALKEASARLDAMVDDGEPTLKRLAAYAERTLERHDVGGDRRRDPVERFWSRMAHAERLIARSLERELEELVAPDCDDATALDLLRANGARAEIAAAYRRARLWRSITRELKRRWKRDRLNTVVVDAERTRIRTHALQDIRAFDPLETPTLVLDATADEQVVSAVMGKHFDAEHTHSRARDLNVQTRQLGTTVLGKTTLEAGLDAEDGVDGTEGDAEDSRNREARRREQKRRSNRLRDLVRLVRARVAAGKSVGVITHKRVKAHIKEEVPAVIAAHFGELRGLDHMRDVDELFVIGRPQPSPQAIDHLTRSVFGAVIDEVIDSDAADLETALRGLRMRDSSPAPVLVQQPRGERQQRVMAQIREAELMQAVGRARLVRRADGGSCLVWLMTNVPIDIDVDEVLQLSSYGHQRDPFRVAAPDRLTESVSRTGVLLRSPRDLAVAHPDLWDSENAAKLDLKRRQEGGLADELVGDIVGRAYTVSYRRAGARGRPSIAVLHAPEKGGQIPYNNNSYMENDPNFESVSHGVEAIDTGPLNSNADDQGLDGADYDRSRPACALIDEDLIEHARAVIGRLVGPLSRVKLVERPADPEPSAAELLATEPDLAAMHDAGIVAVCDVVDGDAVVPLGDGRTTRLPTASRAATMVLGEGELAVLKADVDAGPDDDPPPVLIDAAFQDRAAA